MHINNLPNEMLLQILTSAFPKKPMESSAIHLTCTRWYGMLLTSLEHLYQVNSVLKKLKERHQAVEQNKQAELASLSDEMQKICFKDRSLLEFDRDEILLTDQLEMLAQPPATGPGNAYAQILMFNLHGASFFSDYLEVKESEKFLSEVIPHAQRNPVKAYYYLELAAQHNSFAQELWQRITLPSAFYCLLDSERIQEMDADSHFSCFVARLIQEQNQLFAINLT